MPPAQASGFPSPCVLVSDLVPPVGQDRLKLWHICQAILTRSGAGAPELQRGARCADLAFLGVFMKHPPLINSVLIGAVEFFSEDSRHEL